MNRPKKYWFWLLADLSLDRATSVLPLIGFPEVDIVVFQRCIRNLGPRLDPLQDKLASLYEELGSCVSVELGDESKAVDAWLRNFRFSDEVAMPAAYYWDSRFADIFALDPVPAPGGIDSHVWQAVLAAYRGEAPKSGLTCTPAFDEAADVMSRYRTISRTIEDARREILTSYDLDLYLRFGWNDHGTQKGLTSLEIGARLSSVASFWRAISGLVPDCEIEALSHQRDVATWEAAAKPEAFVEDAKRYGVSPYEMAAEVFPKPTFPPRLESLLEEE